MKVLHFLQYHNAVPVALGVLFLGAGATFAATNPESIYSTQQTVVSIDNTYIANKNISNYSPQVQIVSVTEDTENYYVSYRFMTIDIQNSVWQDVVKSEIMTVSKADLGQYRDLGVYVTQQLKQIVDREVERLVSTQEIERRNVTQKTVATAYGGLIGKFLDSTTEELPGYTPVVTPPPPPQVAAAAVPETTPPSSEPTSSVPPTSNEQVSIPPPQNSTSTTVGPTIQILGENPVRVTVGGTYSDLGASITGPTPEDLNLNIRVYVDGHQKTASIVLDTSVPRVWTIRYEATNAAGATSFVERQVIIGASPPSAAASTPPVTTSSSTPPTTTTPTSTPATTTAPSTPQPITATTTPETTNPSEPATTTPESSSQPTPIPTPTTEPAATSTPPSDTPATS